MLVVLKTSLALIYGAFTSKASTAYDSVWAASSVVLEYQQMTVVTEGVASLILQLITWLRPTATIEHVQSDGLS